jgi:hypothetical protein
MYMVMLISVQFESGSIVQYINKDYIFLGLFCFVFKERVG